MAYGYKQVAGKHLGKITIGFGETFYLNPDEFKL